jgi:hypothetical protein
MNHKFSTLKGMAVAAALLAAFAGAAHADDDMGRFGGDGYAYFHEDKPGVGSGSSAQREVNPQRLSFREEQALSDESQVYQLQRPVINYASSTFRQTDPHGLSYRDEQALVSSGSPTWKLPAQGAAGTLASIDNPVVATSTVGAPSTANSSN